VATHDEARIDLARRLAGSRSQPFEFQMLYGVRTRLQQELVREGYPLRSYVPYGSQWYPYLTRRLAERPANLFFFLRAVVGR
jgi:proline dehydrogenase